MATQVTLNSGSVDSAGSLALKTNGTTTAVTIDTSQNVGVGTSSPVANTRLHVHESASTTSRIRLTNSTTTDASGKGLGIFQSGVDTYFTNNETGAEIFSTSGSERARIDSSGNVGIGTSSPEERLTVFATNPTDGRVLSLRNNGTSSLTGTKLWFNQNTVDNWNIGQPAGVNAFVFCNSTGATNERMRIDSGGNLLVGTTDSDPTVVGARIKASATIPQISVAVTTTSNNYLLYNTTAAAYRFFVTSAGVVNATTTTITAISDQRWKENIRDLDDGLEKVLALKPRKFDWKEGKGEDTKNARGFIAQELETVFPDMVTEWIDPAPDGEESYKAVNANLIPTLVKAIQEQQALITTLTDRITALEAK